MSEQSIIEITQKLGEAYKSYKKGEKEKDSYRKEFFKLADQEVDKHRDLTLDLHRLYGPSEEEARNRAQSYWPHLHIEEVRAIEDGYFELIVSGLPEYQPYSFVNPEDKQFYRRQAVAGSLQLDDELLKTRDSELYLRVTYVSGLEWLAEFLSDLGVEADDLEAEIESASLTYDLPRSLKSLDQIDEEDLAELKQYMYQGPPQIKLAPPRKAKPEEL